LNLKTYLQGNFRKIESPLPNTDQKKQSILITFYSGKTEDPLFIDNNYLERLRCLQPILPLGNVYASVFHLAHVVLRAADSSSLIPSKVTSLLEKHLGVSEGASQARSS